MQKYLKIGEVAKRYCVSHWTIRAWSKDSANAFPEPHIFGPATHRWSVAELDAYDAAKVAA